MVESGAKKRKLIDGYCSFTESDNELCQIMFTKVKNEYYLVSTIRCVFSDLIRTKGCRSGLQAHNEDSLLR